MSSEAYQSPGRENIMSREINPEYTYVVYGETKGAYVPWIDQTFARNVPAENVIDVVRDAESRGWRNVRYARDLI